MRKCMELSEMARLYTFHGTTGWQMLCFKEYRLMPAIGDQIMAIGRAYHSVRAELNQSTVNGSKLSMQPGWTPEEQLAFYVKLHERYWERIQTRVKELMDPTLIFSKKAQVDFVANTLTQDMEELLARGFIHYEDCNWEGEDDEYSRIMWHPTTDLTWPKLFSSKSMAEANLVKWGIPGTIIQKLYNVRR